MTNRYLVGIDLGTTHTVVAYADSVAQRISPAVELFSIEQLVAPGEVAARSLLPSLRYHSAPGEFDPRDIAVPWPEPNAGNGGTGIVIGELARVLGAKVPGRLVASAKSWLSHPSVDRTAPILPWGAAADVAKISPVGASASYLAHVRACWNHHFVGFPLEAQAVVLTVPASFDEAARALTLEAARIAGLSQVQLLEEPQAACYDWLSQHREELASALGGCRLLLVCDVGGGTTDFTLIKLDWRGPQPQFARVGVGKHLMLGGDNMDLALAHVAERRMQSAGGRLGAAGLSLLVQHCRVAKERLLAEAAPADATVSVLGGGAKLVEGARSTVLGRAEVRSMVIGGFFPRTAAEERPQRRRGGILEFGLPYAADPAVPRHLAAFLNRHEAVCRDALGDKAPPPGKLVVPDSLLINGGVFRSSMLVDQLSATLADWRGEPLNQLRNDVPDVAVARGAVAYGLARRGQGIRIGGGSARSYFLVVPRATGGAQGVCLLPKGSEEATEIRLRGTTFALRVGEPVQFHLVYSDNDMPYEPAEVVDIGGEAFAALPPIATVLSETAAGRRAAEGEVPVVLAASLTAVGTLELNCVAQDDPSHRWQLAFDVRRNGLTTSARANSTVLNPRFGSAAQRLQRVFGKRVRAVGPGEVKTLRRDLERLLGPRDGWDTLLLRELFGCLWDGVRHRRRSADHECSWLNLAGYCLRPGYGYPLDDWRVQQVWSLHDQGLQYAEGARLWSEWWTLWRRLAGGLDRAAHERLLRDVEGHFRASATGRRTGRGMGTQQGYEDAVRMVAALERLPAESKVRIGTWLVERLRATKEPVQSWWAVGRLGARLPFYGSAHNVVSVSVAERWLAELFEVDWRAIKAAAFAATLIARRTGDRERDLPSSVRAEVIHRLRAAKAAMAWVRMVSEISEMNQADEKLAFGESLPPGLRLIH